MATITYKIGNLKQDNTRTILFTLSHKGERKRLSSDIIVTNNDLTKENKLKSGRVKKAVEIKLSSLRSKLYNIESSTLLDNYDVEWLYSQIVDKQETLDFYKYAEQWIANSTNKGKCNYAVMLNSIKRFYPQDELPFSKITYKFLTEYKEYLRDYPRAQSLYLGCIRHIFNEAIKEYNTEDRKVILNNPFQSFTLPKDTPKTKDRVVSEETLVKLFKFKGTKRVGLARDCYILSFCLIGMNSVDLYQCTSYNKGILSYNRAKTRDRRTDNAHIEIHVPNIVKPLFKKYRGISRVFDFSQRYSNASNFNKNINKGLHTIADTLNVPKFDFYSARHTWASIARNKLGIDKYTIHEALNHVSELDITDLYIQKDYTNINKANAQVMDYIMRIIASS